MNQKQRDELFKATGMLAGVHNLLEKGDVEDRHAAMGCLVALAESEKHFMEVVTYRVSSDPKKPQNVTGGWVIAVRERSGFISRAGMFFSPSAASKTSTQRTGMH